jgi:predicted DCC family thiol-disulfide oxidoreductase YuxK
MNQPEQHIVLLFDGHCNLCSGLVQFILKNDRSGKIKMASLQSQVGMELLQQQNISEVLPDSMVLIKGGKVWFESDAALHLALELENYRRLGKFLFLLPRFLRDWGYRLVARNRYQIWGKSAECYLPDPVWKERFL